MGGDDTFRGEICGFGTASGTRVVVGRWPVSPFGSFVDAMLERADGRRTFLAPDDEVAAYVTGVYSFDELVVAPIDVRRETGSLHVTGGPLVAEVSIGRRDALGLILHAVPQRLATSPAWATAIDPIARVVLRGVRTRGDTPGGREFYAATDRHTVTSVRAAWGGTSLGDLADVDPPVRFGFSSTPRRPSIVAVTTTVRRRD